uniref:Histone-lysine N-methyltransferase 2C n=1 Tax=Scleropages formosus TaxID=113540 RepID=A0A8C9T658_SCLFO
IMSSEDKSQEASDCGLSPPPGGAGTTPVGSPTATDKRPRGRPRKDAAAATPKSRRKSRSRGKATADDEDSLDGMETGETEITQEAGELQLSSVLMFKVCFIYLFSVFQGFLVFIYLFFLNHIACFSREKLCAFCYCGERSLLGQGELKLFGPTPGYVPLHIRNRRACSENDDDGSPEQDTVGSLASATGFREEPSHKPWEELGNIGLPDGTDVQSLFDPTGQCCAHQRCAVWSRGVCRGEGTSLLNVDKAIDSGSTESCAYCKRLGASIKCCQEECSRSYHYPCAAAAGTFQDFRKLTLLCPKHIELAIERSKDEANCAVCDSPGDLLDQLFCTTCGQHYHGTCLDIGVTPLKRAGWQCPECKVCQTCKNPGEDSKMLVCDTCDKGYHTFCLQPVMDSIPTNGWRCKNCRVCIQCGTKTSSQWHHNCLLCEFCYQQQDAGASCPLCGKPLGAEFLSDHLTCQSCKRYLHLECERQAGGRTDPLDREGYICTLCKHMELEVAETHTCPAHEALAPSLESLPCKSRHSRGITPPSEHSFSDLSSPTAEDKAPKYSPEASSESSAKLATSPLSAEASPRQISQSQGSSLAAGYIGNVPSATFIPVTPKIGMGKPAISKRKFSPGRPRVKQGTWSNRSVFSSPSWSPDRWDGWDAAKTRQPANTPIWSIKVGRGSNFPGRRRPRGTNLSGRGGRGRSKLKNDVGPLLAPGVSMIEPFVVKEEEENTMHNTVVMFSSSDVFTMRQDMCVVCGSFGQGAEGRLLACSQCGQCYHPYCVNIKITRVVLSKGWRCLECTVCEACGQASDPGRLLLCDDCDISYHTYCLDPPLQTVPKGSWKCKWCVSCTQCGATSPGVGCEWQNNYTLCAPCASLTVCPICCHDYRQDELIVQCRQCDRWMHACCQNLNSDEEVENVADDGFECAMCHVRMPPSQGKSGCECDVYRCAVSTSDPQKTYTQDGVCLTESGLSQLQSLAAAASRRKRPKPKLKLKIINQNSVAVLQTPPDPQSEHSRDADVDDSREGDLLDCEGKSDSSPERDPPEEDSKVAEGSDGTKKRKRKPYRPGIGGFMVRQRSRTGQGKAKRSLSRKDSSGSVSENLLTKDEGWSELASEMPIDDILPGPDTGEKVKKRYRKKKTKLEEEFPSYLQEAFFGKDLLDRSKQSKQTLEPGLSDDDPVQAGSKPPSANSSFLDPLSDPLLSAATTPVSGKAGTLPSSEDPLADLSEVLNTDDDLLGMLSDDLVKPGDDSDEPAVTPSQPHPGRGPRTLPDEPLDGILSPELDKMVTDGETENLFLSCHWSVRWLEDKKFSQMGGDVVGPWGMPIPPPPAEGEVDTMSNAQRSTLKWEKEETLGEMATVAPVLYTNMNFPNLKEEFPDWSTRVKQIAKLWRKASSQERSPYVQKARDNRAALRINKVQMSNDPSKRQQQSDLFDPNVPLDSDILFKDPLKHKESEHEQEWKFRQQMRQKSKQQAKIEASQKLEQVKNEQQLQQQQQQQQFGSHSGGNTPNSGNQSPMTPQPTNGSTSPVQHMVPKDSLACSQLPGTPTSGSLDDVFLRPQPPPPTGTRLTEACSQGQASQPQSPQMFSTGTASSSSRPSSPWDPYAKMVGTPRPPPIGSSTPRRNSTESCSAPRLPSEQQERGRPSSGHESFGSPTSASVDPYAKPPDTPRPAVTADPFVKPMGPPKAGIVLESQGRHMPASVIGDAFARPSHRAEAYQRMSHNKMVLSDPYSKPLLTPIPGSNESGSVPLFKAPMPPPHPQDLYNSTPSIGRRNSVDSFERPTRLSDTFSQNSQNDPYAHPPLTPCTSMNDNFSNSPKMIDAFAQASSTSRSDFTQKSPDPYTQPPGTPRPSDPYAQPPGTPRPAYDPYAQPPGTPRPFDPYSKPPGTPRPASDSFSNSASRPGGVDQYSPQQPSNRRSSPSHAMEPYPQPPGTPCPGTGERFSKSPVSQRNADSYFQQPETPRLVKNDTYVTMQENFVRLAREVKDQVEVGHEGSSHGVGQFSNLQQSTSNSTESQSGAQLPLGDTEEKLRQRQRLRELILRQQQQKSAIRQEKGLQEPSSSIPGTPRQWSQEETGQQNELFNRPPPPYPGTARGSVISTGQRFPGLFPGEQRGFSADVANMGMRPPEPRFGFPSGGQVTLGGQGHFLRSPHHMQGPMIDVPQQMRRSLSVDLSRTIGNNSLLLPQHFPPRSIPLQQHNIMGQPFIELRHRAPENRVRLPFAPPAIAGNVVDQSVQSQRPADPMLSQPSGITSHMQISSSMENPHQQSLPLNTEPQQAPVMRSSHPATTESFNVAPSALLSITPADQPEDIAVNTEGIEEKLDTDDSAVKDLEDVEVKDLDDEDLENLNLDPDSTKELDLETSDLHLDDFLKSGKFDIIAYTDPDLDLGDKKDMFNEELDLSDPIDDQSEASDLQKALSEKRNASSVSTEPSPALTNSTVANPSVPGQGKVKQESTSSNENNPLHTEVKTEVKECLNSAHESSGYRGLSDENVAKNQGGDGNVPSLTGKSAHPVTQSCAIAHPVPTPVLSSLLIEEKLENAGFASVVPTDHSGPGAQGSQLAGMPQNSSLLMAPGHIQEVEMNPSVTIGHRMDPSPAVGTTMGNPEFLQGPSVRPNYGAAGPQGEQIIPTGGQPMTHNQQLMFSQGLNQQNRPLLLEEQPLLLQDLLDQERQEQQQQRQMQAMIRQRSNDSFFPNIDFDAITDPIMKAKMVALKGINKMMVQSSMGMPPMVMNRSESLPSLLQNSFQDGKLASQLPRRNPPNFGPGFVNDSQKKQYEEWLQHTQQLLKMQQKFLEEQIGAHRKSKKALSAKQRTAKKAGREFPEEDAEQLKHVTEQQSVVQKQLEQIRKQQKEHAELIEEYRVKHLQCSMQQPPMVAGMQPQTVMLSGGPPINQPRMSPMMQMQPYHNQPNAPRMSGIPGWHPGAPRPIGPGVPAPMASQAPSANTVQPVQTANGGGAPHVKFDDNNPFSEGFQERERKERLREQQERQRVQLMQEVERQRALQQRMEMEQQGLLGPDGNQDTLSQMAFYGTDLPRDFMQPQRPSAPQQMFPQQGVQPSFMSSSPGTFFMQTGERRPLIGNGSFSSEMGPSFRPKHLMLQGPSFGPGQPRPPGFTGPGMMPQGSADGPPFGVESATPLPPNYPGSGQSLIQLYSNIIPEEKGKKKRNRKKKKDDDVDSVKTPSTPHSDLTAPLTPCVSDTSSTPTRGSQHLGEQDSCELHLGSSTPGSLCGQPPFELERQLSGGSNSTGGGAPPLPGPCQQPSTCIETDRAPPDEQQNITGEIKLERMETNECHGPREPKLSEEARVVKVEEGTLALLTDQNSSQSGKGESGNELLKHLLKNKDVPPLHLQQRLEDDKTSANNKPISVDASRVMGSLAPDHSKKKQRTKRAPKSAEKAVSRYKKRKKEDEEQGGQICSCDIFQQNNLSNPPTPPASLPPTPPPVARQKMVNGFATTEELARKSVVLAGHDVTKTLGAKQLRPEEDLLARAIAQGPKTVDVPASLPTPPHNNQEELRGQDMCEDRDTPDSFIPSSSPESVVGMEINRYPDLSRVKKEPPSPAPSPVIPMLPSAIGKGSEAKQWDVKLEPQSMSFGPHFGQLPNCSKTGLVSIAITLNPTAAENITGVMAAMADLLCVKIPNSYEVSSTPDRGPLAMLGGLRIPSQGLDRHLSAMYSMHSTGSQGIMRFMRPPGAPGVAVDQGEHQAAKGNMGSKSQWCCHCKVVVLGTGVQKSSKDLLCNKQDGWNQAEVDMVFCSHSCFVLYSATMQSKAMDTKVSLSVLPKSDIKESPSKILHPYSNNISTLDVHCLAQLQPRQSPPSTPPITFPSAAYDATKADALKVTVKLKPRPRAVHIGVDDPRHTVKRWKGLRWRKWSVQVMMPRSSSQLPSEDEVDRLLQKLGSSLRPEPLPRDQRKCCFCHEEGDGLTDGPARLLNLDLDLWVHLNCALWSTEVYETQAGALINVELALRRGLSIRCVYCQRTGATSGCHRLRCTNVYHFTCALKAQCTFFKDKTMLCHAHKPRGGGGQEHELRYFAVFRRVYVQRDEVRQLASVVRRSERDHTFRVGSLVLHTVGQLLPQQMAAFHGSSAIFPVGYESSRIYWSMRHGNRRCRYLCSIDEKEGSPEFIIRVVEQGYEDLVLKGTTPKGVWDQVLEQVAQHRTETGTLKLFPVYLKGEDLFGLTVSAVTRIIESLPGVEACENYAFRYGRNPLMQLPLAINPSGCARSEPRAACHVKRFVLRPHTLTSTSTSKSFQSTITGEIGAPYSKQFVHSKSSQYRKMKTEWKTNVYLARSRIQGLGLYAARDIEKYTMVIEYIGTIIRNEVANRKEKMYESQNRGVYMFRIDSEHVIDATITGGPARYINHSCAPNCVAEVVTFEKGHKIIISSNRKIQRGEELCYDYKFDLEDDQHKIPCHCGAVNCRKWMN